MLLGINAGLYYNTGTYGLPTWTEITDVSDVKLDLSFQKVALPTRNSKVIKSGKTVAEAPLQFTIKQHLTDAAFLAVWAALISNTDVIDLMVLNAKDDVNGARGVRGEFVLYSLTDDQAITNALVYQIAAEPADTDNDFSTVVVTAGAPVFTAF